MKRLILISIVAIGLWGCREQGHKYTKPFIITDKEYLSDGDVKGYVRYYYQDATGFVEYFREKESMYHIGDTIK